jgi:DNA polymerase
MPTLYLDIESRSKISLKNCGSFRYCADPSTEPLFLCWAVDDGDVYTWRQGDPVLAPFFAAAADPADWDVVAHNYFFELPFCELILAPRFGFPIISLEAWHCTMRLALANAHPAELGLLAQALGLPYTKDAKAVKALREVCRPKKGGEWDEDPAKLELVRQRCVTDVQAARAIWRHPGLRHLDEFERRLQIRDAKINARGVGFNRAFVTAARDFATAERNGINTRLYELTDGAISTIDQVQKLRAAINARGHEMDTLGKRAVATVLANDPDEVTKQLLELRRDGARSSVRKFAKILEFADANDDRLRGTLTMYGASTGRWTAPGPMLHNLKRNELGVPLSVLDAVIHNDRPYIAQFGSPLTVLSNISRGMLVARPGHLLYSADYRMIESRVLAWDAGEEWKLQLHREYDRSGDHNLEPYRVLASQMLNQPIEQIGANERQKGKFAELAAGFGGGIGAWRRIFDDRRPDAEIERDKIKWRGLHPRIVMFWHRLFRAVRIAVQMGAAVRVNEPPLPEIVCYFEAGTLYISLPSGRCLTYPGARLVPGKFEGSVDLAYFDNSKKQWRETRAWYGMIVENVISAVARDLLAAAIVRFETRGLPIVFHWHDEVIAEIPADTITDAQFLAILLEPPAWATGLPLAGSVHSGLHYLPASDEPVAKTAPVEIVTDTAPAPILENPIEQALDELIAEPASIDYSPAELRTFAKEDAQDEIDNLDEHAAPLYEIAELAIASGSAKVICPFHEDSSPSCMLYADHFYCFGCGARGSRLDWLTEVEGMTGAEAAKLILEWDGERRITPVEDQKVANTARALALWKGGKPIAGTLAERYLAETRKIAIDRLPDTITESLRFYARCPYGKGVKHPCLIALMTGADGAPCGIHRIALAETAGKVDKIGRMALGAMGTVRLWPANGRLVVGEGIETTLAAATRIPHRGQSLTPAWAAVSDGGMNSLPVIDGVSELILLVDHDRNGAGQNAAMSCERRWRQAGRDVLQLMPNEPGWDFNDVVMRRGV